MRVTISPPRGLAAGRYELLACADTSGAVRERSERNDCRDLGALGRPPCPEFVAHLYGDAYVPIRRRLDHDQDDDGSNLDHHDFNGRGPRHHVPADPVRFGEDDVFTLDNPQSNYWVYVPTSYDSTHQTPVTLFVWLHGCGGESAGDIYTVSPAGAQSCIAVAVGGREGDCWDVNSDSAKVLAAIASVKTHFNINPRRVILGGYSSGGDLAYRTAFYNAKMFAESSPRTPRRSATPAPTARSRSPPRRGSSTSCTSPTPRTRRIRSPASTRDDALTAAGFPVTVIERPGTHYDNNTDARGTGTDWDLVHQLLPYLDAGWRSP